MVRPRVPFGFMAGYAGLPERTLEAWRSFWFHTGDSGVMDESGWVTFVDRTKDCIRRRGENISSFEVESAVARLEASSRLPRMPCRPGRRAPRTRMLAVVVDPGSGLDAAAVAGHADRVLPRFAQPRYVEVVEELPKTPTAKVRKQQPAPAGVTEGAWDRHRQQPDTSRTTEDRDARLRAP